MRIQEEGLIFGDFDEENCFHIEDTRIYNRLRGQEYSSVEFVLHRPDANELFFVEGKTSLPDKKNLEDLDENIREISKKFMDSFHLACGIWFGGHSKRVETPLNAASFFTYGTQVVFVLVIKNRRGKLSGIKEKINLALKRERRLLGFEVRVVSEEIAVEAKLVVDAK